MRDPVQFLAFGFGSGLSPWAPGTAGSAVAILVYLLFTGLPLGVYSLGVAVAAVLGVWICGAASRRLGVHDHPGIVWDEFVGMWIALWAVPTTPLGIGLAFVAFRCFDIVKPWPIGWLDEHTKGGFGILIDDVVAGVFACATVHLVLRFGGA